MHFARDILVRAVQTDGDYQELQDALSLMGYDDPTSSPCGQMMSQQVHACSHILMISSSIDKHFNEGQWTGAWWLELAPQLSL